MDWLVKLVAVASLYRPIWYPYLAQASADRRRAGIRQQYPLLPRGPESHGLTDRHGPDPVAPGRVYKNPTWQCPTFVRPARVIGLYHNSSDRPYLARLARARTAGRRLGLGGRGRERAGRLVGPGPSRSGLFARSSGSPNVNCPGHKKPQTIEATKPSSTPPRTDIRLASRHPCTSHHPRITSGSATAGSPRSGLPGEDVARIAASSVVTGRATQGTSTRIADRARVTRARL
jgi:hypothetical protein